MSVMDERAHRFLDSIEIPEGYRVELLNGEIILSPSGKPLHWKIQLSLIQQFSLHSQWQIAAEQTVRHPGYSDEPQPDFFAMPAEASVDLEGTYRADHVSLVAEVLSRSTKATDLMTKVEVYARFGIPLYLIVDPFKRRCTLHSVPASEGYTDTVHVDFGHPIPLPEPFGFAIDTSAFPAYRSADGS
ncbi:Uma2 family endonuclease [Kitasatospora mediocidica]|uniref:Uma2 family endonuclease n=1 Tax=Kitasatospora mediocidica TaxID=58352 RepID=UPI00055C15F0|nr:Uma2 family endonuclease [Kitasatospora mediocidica]